MNSLDVNAILTDAITSASVVSQKKTYLSDEVTASINAMADKLEEYKALVAISNCANECGGEEGNPEDFKSFMASEFEDRLEATAVDTLIANGNLGTFGTTVATKATDVLAELKASIDAILNPATADDDAQDESAGEDTDSDEPKEGEGE